MQPEQPQHHRQPSGRQLVRSATSQLADGMSAAYVTVFVAKRRIWLRNFRSTVRANILTPELVQMRAELAARAELVVVQSLADSELLVRGGREVYQLVLQLVRPSLISPETVAELIARCSACAGLKLKAAEEHRDKKCIVTMSFPAQHRAGTFLEIFEHLDQLNHLAHEHHNLDCVATECSITRCTYDTGLLKGDEVMLLTPDHRVVVVGTITGWTNQHSGKETSVLWKCNGRDGKPNAGDSRRIRHRNAAARLGDLLEPAAPAIEWLRPWVAAAEFGLEAESTVELHAGTLAISLEVWQSVPRLTLEARTIALTWELVDAPTAEDKLMDHNELAEALHERGMQWHEHSVDGRSWECLGAQLVGWLVEDGICLTNELGAKLEKILSEEVSAGYVRTGAWTHELTENDARELKLSSADIRRHHYVKVRVRPGNNDTSAVHCYYFRPKTAQGCLALFTRAEFDALNLQAAVKMCHVVKVRRPNGGLTYWKPSALKLDLEASARCVVSTTDVLASTRGTLRMPVSGVKVPRTSSWWTPALAPRDAVADFGRPLKTISVTAAGQLFVDGRERAVQWEDTPPAAHTGRIQGVFAKLPDSTPRRCFSIVAVDVGVKVQWEMTHAEEAKELGNQFELTNKKLSDALRSKNEWLTSFSHDEFESFGVSSLSDRSFLEQMVLEKTSLATPFIAVEHVRNVGSVAAWLDEIQMGAYKKNFSSAGVKGSELSSITNSSLQALGVRNQVDCNKILLHVKALTTQVKYKLIAGRVWYRVPVQPVLVFGTLSSGGTDIAQRISSSCTRAGANWVDDDFCLGREVAQSHLLDVGTHVSVDSPELSSQAVTMEPTFTLYVDDDRRTEGAMIDLRGPSSIEKMGLSQFSVVGTRNIGHDTQGDLVLLPLPTAAGAAMQPTKVGSLVATKQADGHHSSVLTVRGDSSAAKMHGRAWLYAVAAGGGQRQHQALGAAWSAADGSTAILTAHLEQGSSMLKLALKPMHQVAYAGFFVGMRLRHSGAAPLSRYCGGTVVKLSANGTVGWRKDNSTKDVDDWMDPRPSNAEMLKPISVKPHVRLIIFRKGALVDAEVLEQEMGCRHKLVVGASISVSASSTSSASKQPPRVSRVTQPSQSSSKSKQVPISTKPRPQKVKLQSAGARTISYDLNELNHCVAHFDSVAQYAAARTTYLDQVLQTCSMVEDAITGNKLRIKDQLLLIGTQIDDQAGLERAAGVGWRDVQSVNDVAALLLREWPEREHGLTSAQPPIVIRAPAGTGKVGRLGSCTPS